MKKSIYTYINLQSENTKVKIDKFLTNQSASEKWEPSYNQTKILIRGRLENE
jgi:adenine-specific DNA methylase